MGVQLEAVRENLPKNGWNLLIATSEYGLKVEELGVSQKTYISEDFIRGEKEGTFGVFIWSVLTQEASEMRQRKSDLRKINQYSRELREGIAGFGLPLEVHTSFIRPERVLALRDHLERNRISYTV